MNLALFDLDYTLLPIDSDHGWSQFLGEIGVIDGAEHNRRNDEFFAQYKAGNDKIRGFLMGQVMKATRGQANPKVLGTLLGEALARARAD